MQSIPFLSLRLQKRILSNFQFLLTAGENKGMLDPFSPQNEQHRAFAKAMIDQIHQQFIAVVKAGRGKRLKETPDMFSGLMWTGAKSIELGLTDGYGSLDFVAREVIKAEDIPVDERITLKCQIPRCFEMKENFTSIPSRSRPRLFLGCLVRPSA